MLLRSLDAQTIIITSVLIGVYFLTATFTGFLQAAYATFLGDDTAKEQGFLTFNPFVFVDVIGFILLLFVGIGWGNAIPFDSRVVSAPFRKLKIASFYFSRIVGHILLVILAKLFLVNILSMPLDILRDITYKGFQHQGELIAQGYSPVIILLGLFGVYTIYFNITMASLRTVLVSIRFVFDYVARLVDIDLRQMQEVSFFLIFALLFIFSKDIDRFMNMVNGIAFYYLFGG